MNNKLTILFAPLEFIGNVNASIGVAEMLRDRGHRIVFVLSENWREKLTIYGFEEVIINYPKQKIEDPAKFWAQYLLNKGFLGGDEPINKIKTFNKIGFIDIINRTKVSDIIMKEILNDVKPNIIVVGGFQLMPSLLSSGIPWVWLMTCNPLVVDYAMDVESLPPSTLGLPLNSDCKVWEKFRNEKNEAILDSWTSYNDWLISQGYPSLPKYKLITPSPYLSIYQFPEELDYRDVAQFPSHFHQIDCFKRTGNEEAFEIPEKLRNRSGKLIYLSMGSMGGADVQLMKKFVSILSKSKHRFIVSKGPLHDSYELADNMWGEKNVPQIKILPIIDLYITHGGNNSVTECCFFGKPMLVMPLFFDQFDNAQRVHEKGFGIRLDPYECSETQLLESIDKLLNDKELALRLQEMSKRIQNSNKLSKVTQIIENLPNRNFM